jgi:hypothetical protein
VNYGLSVANGCPWSDCDGTVNSNFTVACATVDPDDIEDFGGYDTVTENGRCKTCGRRAYRHHHPNEDALKQPWHPAAA